MRHSATHHRRAIVMALSLAAYVLTTLVSAAPAHAGTLTETVTVPPTDTDYATVVELPQFDQSNGVLQSVTIDLVGDVVGIMQIENLSTSSPSTGTVTLAATMTMTSQADPTIALTPALPADSEAFTLDVFDGNVNFGGPSGQTFDDLSGSDAVSATFSDPAELAPFIGTGTIGFDLTAVATSNAAATGGNIELIFTTLAGATVNVTYQFAEPAIDIEKTPNQQTVVFGSDVTFTIDVTNTGEVDLTNVAVTDALTPDCDTVIGDLAVGETVTYDCTAPAVTQDFTNVAVVTGEDSIGNVVTDEDDADVNVLVPLIEIQKTPDQQTVVFRADVTFTIDVTNIGEVDLFDVVVTDPLTPDCDREIGDLAIGDTVTYECTLPKATQDFTNVADVIGEDEQGNVVTDQDDAVVDVLAPDITIEKSPNVRTVLPGGDAPFTIDVTNTGDVDLFNVVVRDALVPGCNADIGFLAVGETVSFTCVATGVTSPFTNVADVTGEDEEGNQVTDTDDAAVIIGLPETGSDTVELSLAGLIMLLAGGALVVFERRRTAE